MNSDQIEQRLQYLECVRADGLCTDTLEVFLMLEAEQIPVVSVMQDTSRDYWEATLTGGRRFRSATRANLIRRLRVWKRGGKSERATPPRVN